MKRDIRDMPMQNIPIKTELGRAIRKGMAPAPGTVLCCTDFSALEIRIYSELFGDTEKKGV